MLANVTDMNTKNKIYITQKFGREYDIMYLVENYYNNNLGDRYNWILGGGIKYLKLIHLH